mgnify:CR=1 FL=1
MIWRNVRAVARREWRSYFNSPIAYVFLIIFLVLAAFFTFFVGRLYEAGQADLRVFFMWHPWLYLVLVPAAAMRLWSEERRSGTIELLLTLPMSPLEALLGKFLAAWLFLAVALALTVTIPLSVSYLGRPDPGVIVTGYLGSLLLAGAYLAIGLFTSALTRNQVISFIVAVVIGLFLILCGYPPVTDFVGRFLPTAFVDAVAAFSFMTHFETLQRGVVDVRDLIYFAGVMMFMLFATQAVLKERAGK